MANPTIPRLFDLSDRVAIVTGGALGIGQGIASRLADAGAAVMIADVNDDAAAQTADGIRGSGGRAATVRADLADVASIQAMVQRTVETLGRLDILVNNAGVFPLAPALQVTEAQWDRVLDINLKGAFFAAQAAAQAMIAGGRGGRIVNIASIDALHPSGALAHYDASKGGMVMLTKSLARELAQHHITVNAIAPGGIHTPGATAVMAAMRPAEASAPTVMDAFEARIPLGRMGEPDDIAKVALFLASGAADYMTGALLVVDGGYLLS